MSDSESFFGLSPTSERGLDEDDNDYDALNNETFGRMEEIPNADWEKMHLHNDHLMGASTLEEQSDELSDRLACSMVNCVLDDEREDIGMNTQGPSRTHLPRAAFSSPTQKWTNGVKENSIGTDSYPAHNASSGDYWQKPSQVPFSTVQPMNHLNMPVPSKILTVDEIESRLMNAQKDATTDNPTHLVAAQVYTGTTHETTTATSRGPSHRYSESRSASTSSAGAHGSQHGPAPDDFERLMPYQPTQQNGNYARGGAIPRRPPPRPYQEQPYHAMNHPYPPYPGPCGPPMMRPRHLGPLYPPPRHFEDRGYFHQQARGGMRNHHPRQPIYPQKTKHPHFGRGAPPPPEDEWAGLMSPQEKQWLASIQMMQLNTHQPFQDDYYYTVYSQRHGRKGAVQPKEILRRENPPQRPTSTYTPQQFENSLGRLQIGSVTAPRKIIDLSIVEQVDTKIKNQNEKKTKEVLIEIEKMYDDVLTIEDFLNPANLVNSEIDVLAIQEKVLNRLIAFEKAGKLPSILSIKKGKKLILRLLPILMYPSQLMLTIMKELPIINKKDTENNMLLFLPAIRHFLLTIDDKTLVEIVSEYENAFLFCNKFTISVVANLIERADQLIKHSGTEWDSFLIRTIAGVNERDELERPVIAVPRDILLRQCNLVKDKVPALGTKKLVAWFQPVNTPPES